MSRPPQNSFSSFDQDRFARCLVDIAPTLIYVFDLVERRNVFMSPQIETLFGYSPDEIASMNSSLAVNLFHPDELNFIAAHHAAIRNSTGNGPFEITYRLRHRDGHWKWLVSREVPYERDDTGRITQIVGSALDITELKNGEQRLATALKAGDLGVHEYDVIRDRIHWDQKTRDLWGVDEDEAITYEIFEGGIHPDDVAHVREAIALAMTPAGGGKYSAEFRVVDRRKGAVRWVYSEADVSFAGDKAVRFVGLVRDVTDRHQFQEELDRQKRLYQSVTDNASTSLFVMDHQQRCVFMNPAAVAMTGYTAEETAGRPLHDVIHHTRPDGSHYPLCECPIDRALPNNDLEKGEDVFVHKDGTFYPVAFTASPLRDVKGKPVGTVIEVQDISERKRAEEALRESESRYRTLFDRAAVGLAEVAPDGSWITVNQALCDMLGYTREELARLTWQELTHPDDLDGDLELVNATLRGEIESYRYAKRYFKKSGGIVYARLTVTCVRKDNGTVDYFLPIVEDVSATHQAEKALAASEARYRSVVQDQTEMLCRFRANEQLLLVNSAYAEAFGSSPAEMEGRSFADFLPASYVKKIRSAVLVLSAEQPAITSVYRVRRRDGSRGWQEWTNRRLMQGDEIVYQATGRDVTEQLKAEAKLLQSSQRLRLAAHAASLTYITLDIQKQKISRLDNFSSVMGFDIPDDTPLPIADAIFLAHVHPDDREQLQGHVEAVHNGIAPGQIEFRVVDENHGVRWIECRSQVELGADEKPRRIFVINSDVTSRKSTELQLLFATRELIHRSKNLLTVIQGIAQISARTSQGSTDFIRLFSNRIEALSRSQDLLVHGSPNELDIGYLIKDQMSIVVEDEHRTVLQGPKLMINPEAAQSLGLAVHELATNSLKYGALSSNKGRLEIEWKIEDDQFVLSWRELNGPAVVAPVRTGFGRTIVERVVPLKLGGRASLRFAPHGLEWDLTAPLLTVANSGTS